MHFQFRVPVRQSTSYLDQVETFGSHIDYALGWMPKNINLSSLNNQSQVNDIFSQQRNSLNYNLQQNLLPKLNEVSKKVASYNSTCVMSDLSTEYL